MGKIDGFVNPGARFCLPEAAAVRRPWVKPPSPCLTRYWVGSGALAVAEALLGWSACLSAGAGMETRGRGARNGGGGGRWDSAGEGGEWTSVGDAGACRGPPGAALLLSGPAHHPLCPSVSDCGLPRVVPPSFSGVDQVQSLASTSLRGSLGNTSVSLSWRLTAEAGR